MCDQVFTRLLQLARQPNAFFQQTNQVEITVLIRQLEYEAGCRQASVFAPILIMDPELFVNLTHQRLEYLALVFDRRARLIRLLSAAQPE
ncbi:hypothetical protein CAEBREN_24051 [Caenorhabditis brenneri]|uniref:Uncharacterized protein n=1 Tax=Caenorhabditis brenneri TaxID=135651 RepID=G0N7W1_CAEBE|nr:hypothetical protein CAEBREN_24051 [Caenorhabditis brenneri]